MSSGRKTAWGFSLGLFLIGLWLLGYDVWFIQHYGYDYNDVAGVCDEGPIDWPTGERPEWANLPLYAYSLPFLISGLAAVFIRLQPAYRGRIRLGCE